jgi:PAS domain S-box-containing protein
MSQGRQVRKPKMSVVTAAASAAVAAPGAAAMERTKVLVVDDDERNLQAISVVLEEIAEIVCARSGEEALRFLLKDEFAVILLDVFMPGLDGYETAGFIRQREQSKRTPIIFLTAINKEDAHMLRGYDAGAVDYVFKPFDPVMLQSKVAVFVDLFEKTREIKHQAEIEQRLMEENLRAKSERLLAEQALRRSEERQEAILRSVPVCFHSRDIDPPFGARFVSEAVERLTGFAPERLTGEPEFGLSRVHPDDLPRLTRALNGARETGSYTCEFRWRCADGGYRIFLDQGVLSTNEDGKPAEILGTLLDVTERRQLEDQLMHSQRLDAIGKLTGGIAHDFNNLLAAILSGLGLLERRMPATEETTQITQMMRHAAKQGAELINRMLAFSRRQRLKPDTIRLIHLGETMNGLVAPVLGGLVRFDWRVDESVWSAYVDAGQLELALLNLIFNARDAMPSGGTIIVRGSNRTVEYDLEDLPAGDYAVLTVEDTGSGISPDLLAKVIEPFFTTKDVGKGTGLGLSTVYGFAKQSGGTLRIESVVDSGTAIHIWLPRSLEEPAAPSAMPEAPDKRWSRAGQKSPVILLVDDSISLRELTARVLRDNGFNVVSAGGGAEALSLLEREPQKFDLILTDFAMPLVSGLDVIRFARSVRADWPAIIISGYADAHAVADRPADVMLLSKPFTDAALIDGIQAALKKPAAAVRASA